MEDGQGVLKILDDSDDDTLISVDTMKADEDKKPGKEDKENQTNDGICFC
jgi:hypothetical protein